MGVGNKMQGSFLDFERPLVELAEKISEMEELSTRGEIGLNEELDALKKRLLKLRQEVSSKLTRWQRVQLARHPKRPLTDDYIKNIMSDFIELHGDRLFRDDPSIVAGFAKFEDRKIVVIGHQKGHDTHENIKRNFGMAHPEGYRKAMRIMELGAKFGLPIVIFIDTPGAYPGIGAEERGQAESIARNLMKMSLLPTPIVIIIIGEGASGGALGIGLGDSILMMENSWYSVISPEGCAAILWRDRAKAPQAAEALKVTAQDLLEIGMIDRIIKEPPGGAHWQPEEAFLAVKRELSKELNYLDGIDIEELLQRRLKKYREMGAYTENGDS